MNTVIMTLTHECHCHIQVMQITRTLEEASFVTIDLSRRTILGVSGVERRHIPHSRAGADSYVSSEPLARLASTGLQRNVMYL